MSPKIVSALLFSLATFKRATPPAALAAAALLVLSISACCQSAKPAPFEVQNPQKKQFFPAEAGRIYNSACALVARSIRPDNPPALQPHFRLVLGADDDEFVRNGSVSEIHLKSWNPEKFAEGVVVVAIRDVLHADDLEKIAHQSVILADSTLDVREVTER
ncbi:MAG TPA: hypothetical protein VF753_21700 [Terriglobales bacterium]